MEAFTNYKISSVESILKRQVGIESDLSVSEVAYDIEFFPVGVSTPFDLAVYAVPVVGQSNRNCVTLATFALVTERKGDTLMLAQKGREAFNGMHRTWDMTEISKFMASGFGRTWPSASRIAVCPHAKLANSHMRPTRPRCGLLAAVVSGYTVARSLPSTDT